MARPRRPGPRLPGGRGTAPSRRGLSGPPGGRLEADPAPLPPRAPIASKRRGERIVPRRRCGGLAPIGARRDRASQDRRAGHGEAVAASGETARGAVYVFTRTGATWTQQARLQTAALSPGDGFGFSVALEDSLLAIGVVNGQLGSPGDTGTVSVYRRSGATWNFEQTFTRQGAQFGDRFGETLAIDAGRILIGAPSEDAGAGDAGAVYSFLRPGSNWIQESRFVSPTPTPGLKFGSSLALDAGRIAIGAPFDDEAGADAGAVHTFRFGTSWQPVRKLFAPDAGLTRQFGSAVALAGSALAAGSVNDSSFAANAGSLQLFFDQLTDWTPGPKLGTTVVAPADLLGWRLGMSGNILIAGARFDDDGGLDTGSAYVFDLTCAAAVESGLFTATRCIPVTPLDWSYPIELPRFDPIFGSLTNVRITLRTHFEGALRFENLSTAPAGFSFQAERELQLLRPDATELASVSAPVNGSGTLAGFDGTIDWDGPSGAGFLDLFQDDVLILDTPQPGIDLALFTGPIDDPGRVRLTLAGTSTLSRTAGANVLRGPALFAASGLVKVDYTFEPSGEPYCFGDGGLTPGCTPCPCANDAPPGTQGGCLNLNGTSGRLTAAGTPSPSADTLQFVVEGATPSTFGVLFSGNAQLPQVGACPPGSGVALPPLKGLRCAGAGVLRHGIRPTDPLGASASPWGYPAQSIAAQGGFTAGQTRYFQVFYRELPTVTCMFEQNTTNGVRVQFVP